MFSSPCASRGLGAGHATSGGFSGGKEPLFVLADLASEDWPRIAREAAVALSAAAENHNPIGALLVESFCHFLLTEESRTFSRTLVERHKDQPDRPWTEAKGGKGITERWLAHQLRPYGIHHRTLWIGREVAEGLNMSLGPRLRITLSGMMAQPYARSRFSNATATRTARTVAGAGRSVPRLDV